MELVDAFPATPARGASAVAAPHCGDCGAAAIREVLRERISPDYLVARFACMQCRAEHTRLFAVAASAA